MLLLPGICFEDVKPGFLVCSGDCGLLERVSREFVSKHAQYLRPLILHSNTTFKEYLLPFFMYNTTTVYNIVVIIFISYTPFVVIIRQWLYFLCCTVQLYSLIQLLENICYLLR